MAADRFVLSGVVVFGLLLIGVGSVFGQAPCNVPNSPANITYSLSPSYISSNIMTNDWLIIPANTTLVINNYNITACKGIYIEKGGALVQGPYNNNQPSPSPNRVPSRISTSIVLNDGAVYLYGSLSPGIMFLNNGSFIVGAQNFLNFSYFANYLDGDIIHENPLYNGGSEGVGGSVLGSFAGSGGGGAGSLLSYNPGYAGGSTYAPGGSGGSGINRTNTSAMIGKPGSSVSGSLTNYTFNLMELSSAGGGSASIVPSVGPGSGVYPLFIIARYFINNGTISNQGGSVYYETGYSSSLSGAGGGGIIMVLYQNKYENNGVFNVSGGKEYSNGGENITLGGVGGNGKVFKFKVGGALISASGLSPNYSLDVSSGYEAPTTSLSWCKGPLPVTLALNQSIDGLQVYSSNVVITSQSEIPLYYFRGSNVSYSISNGNLSFYYATTGLPASGSLLLATLINKSAGDIGLQYMPTAYALGHNNVSISFSNQGFFGPFNVSILNSSGARIYDYSFENGSAPFVKSLPTGVYTVSLSNNKSYPLSYTLENTFDCFSPNAFILYPMAGLYSDNGLNVTDSPLYSRPQPKPVNLSSINQNISAVYSELSQVESQLNYTDTRNYGLLLGYLENMASQSRSYQSQLNQTTADDYGFLLESLGNLTTQDRSYFSYASSLDSLYSSISARISLLKNELNGSRSQNYSAMYNQTNYLSSLVTKLYNMQATKPLAVQQGPSFQVLNSSTYIVKDVQSIGNTTTYYIDGNPGGLSLRFLGGGGGVNVVINTTKPAVNKFSIMSLLSYAVMPEIVSVPMIITSVLLRLA